MDNGKERLKRALDAMIFLPHLKDRQSQSVLAALLPDTSGPRGTGRPWDRGDLIHRLKTFRPSTWFAKPEPISATECARRGWENPDVDLLTCESCHAVLSCPIPPQLLPEEANKAAEQLSARLTQSHTVSCPWRATCCSLSLLRFPELPITVMTLDFKERFTALQQLLCLPPLAPAALETLAHGPLGPKVAVLVSKGPRSETAGSEEQTDRPRLNETDGSGLSTDQDLMSGVATCDQPEYTKRLRVVTLCGWSLECLTSPPTSAGAAPSTAQFPCTLGPESAALVCGLCGARAGLWACFPECSPQPVTLGDPAIVVGKNGKQHVGMRGGQRASPGEGSAVNRQVSVDLSTTIAGGALQEAVGGPFGVTTPTRDATEASMEASQSPSVPVFGFEALRASSDAGQKAAKRLRLDDAFWRAASNADASPSSTKGVDTRDSTAGLSAQNSAAPGRLGVPRSGALARWRGMSTAPLDPIALHRRFCPWVRIAPRTSPTAHGASCGWQWAAHQLVPGPDDVRATLSVVEDDELAKDDGDGRSDWNPAALLRSTLAKVEVKKI